MWKRYTCGMWLKMPKQSESAQRWQWKRKLILAAMDTCFSLVRPRQHGIANNPELRVPTKRITSVWKWHAWRGLTRPKHLSMTGILSSIFLVVYFFYHCRLWALSWAFLEPFLCTFSHIPQLYHFLIICYSFCGNGPQPWGRDWSMFDSCADSLIITQSSSRIPQEDFLLDKLHSRWATSQIAFRDVWCLAAPNCALLGMACCGLFASNVAATCRFTRDLDSPWSWLVCFSATFIFALTLGISLNFGVLFPVLMDYFQESRERVGKFSEVLYSWSSTNNSTYFEEFASKHKTNPGELVFVSLPERHNGYFT